MFRMIEKAFLENLWLFRGVNTDELNVGAVAKTVKESGIDRSSSCGLLTSDALIQVKVINQLFAIVPAFSLACIMIADGRIGRHPVDHITIWLIVSEVPIVVLIAVAIDVVAGRQDQPYAEVVNSLFQCLGDLPLPSV